MVTANPKPVDAARVTHEEQAKLGALALPPGVYLDVSGTAQGASVARLELALNTG